MKGFSRRRFLQASGSLVAIPAATSFLFSGCSLQSGTLKIAHDALLTSWDPTTGFVIIGCNSPVALQGGVRFFDYAIPGS